MLFTYSLERSDIVWSRTSYSKNIGSHFRNCETSAESRRAGQDIRIQNTGTNYNETDTLSVSGTAANPIVIEGDNAASPPTLTNTTSTASDSYQMQTDDVDYITIQNLKWDGTGLNVAFNAVQPPITTVIVPSA